MEKLSYKLPVFEGPLDLLLHLITKNKLNIYDIPVNHVVDFTVVYFFYAGAHSHGRHLLSESCPYHSTFLKKKQINCKKTAAVRLFSFFI